MENPPKLSSEINPRPLRIVYMGTPAIAAHVLERLIAGSGENFTVVAVVTRPDQPRKRGLKLEPSEVGAVAEHHGLPTLKPTKIRTPEFLAQLKAFDPDLLVVVAYGRILPNAVLDAPRIMPMNVHASLLPRHRGAAPIEGALLAGDPETGVTIMRITEQMDSGPMLLQRSLVIASDESQGSLKEKLAELGASALIESLQMLKEGRLVETPQNEALVTFTKPITKEESVIDWTGDATQIERMIRAFDPWPVARTKYAGEDLLIWRARVATGSVEGEPGRLIALKPNPTIKCGADALTLIEVQAPGRRRMAAGDFFRGRRAEVGARLG
ncbi:MAG TPA: methionyl-tRNA formyltransferase [Candidatus Binataceae bacterium]|nr:methionyl-tRNA formyltransferase [Candidatus Binataceae bacterium]